jgi:hypothetical protein
MALLIVRSLGAADDVDVEMGSANRSHEAEPDGHIHLLAYTIGIVARYVSMRHLHVRVVPVRETWRRRCGAAQSLRALLFVPYDGMTYVC